MLMVARVTVVSYVISGVITTVVVMKSGVFIPQDYLPFV